MASHLARAVQSTSQRQWTILSAALTLLSAVLTALPVTLILDAETWRPRIVGVILALLLAGLGAWIAGHLVGIRDSRFPDHPGALLKFLQGLKFAADQENELLLTADWQTDGQRRELMAQALKIYLFEFEKALSSSWSEERFGEATQVEVVLMRRADDGYVTVAAWTSKRPTSLVRREQRPDFYEQTEAAKQYREYVDLSRRAPILLIGDISSYPGYDHFGRDPLLRTNSTALFPLYDSSSTCWGFVAATARNRVEMFSDADRRFWEGVWELWSGPIVRCVLEREATVSSPGEDRVGHV